MARRYLILSDLHLCDREDHADGWKAFKSSRFGFDEDFVALLERFVGPAPGPPTESADELTLILNGDVFDFDVVTAIPEDPAWPIRNAELLRGLDPTAGKSAWKLSFILGHHPVWLAGLARFLGGGHRVVCLFGNHDRELHFPAVREVFVAALQTAAAALGLTFDGAQLLFEPWFYLVPGELYVEHGQQYDAYSSFRNLLHPEVIIHRERTIALPMGNLSNRYLLTRMGFFNPYAGDFILNIFAYLLHWKRYYAFSKRSLVFAWLFGSLVVLLKLFRLHRLFARSPPRGPLLDEVAARRSLARATVEALYRLQLPPITTRFFRILREFWLDRLALLTLFIGGTVALALVPIPLWIKLMVPLSSFPLLFFIYELLAQGESIFTIEKRLPEVARRIAALVDVRVVCFGHTHVPRLLPLGRDLSFVDTGTWAPIMDPAHPDRLQPGYRNYLLATFGGARPVLEFGARS